MGNSTDVSENDDKVIKPFLGGYRDRIRNIEFHHAIAQTVQPPKVGTTEAQCRETQTKHLKNAWTQDVRDGTTQMTKVGVYVADKRDKIRLPSKVQRTVDEYLADRLRKVG